MGPAIYESSMGHCETRRSSEVKLRSVPYSELSGIVGQACFVCDLRAGAPTSVSRRRYRRASRRRRARPVQRRSRRQSGIGNRRCSQSDSPLPNETATTLAVGAASLSAPNDREKVKRLLLPAAEPPFYFHPTRPRHAYAVYPFFLHYRAKVSRRATLQARPELPHRAVTDGTSSTVSQLSFFSFLFFCAFVSNLRSSPAHVNTGKRDSGAFRPVATRFDSLLPFVWLSRLFILTPFFFSFVLFQHSVL